MKKQDGITLVALVITIIVMLILAGIVISLAIHQNGVINQAQQTQEKWEESAIREKLILKLGNLQTQKWIDENRKALLNDTKEFITQGSSNYDADVLEVVVQENTVDITIDQYTYTIDENFNIINKMENAQISSVINSYEPLITGENGTYFTIDVSDVTTKDGSNIEKFKYIVNGELKQEINSTTCKLTDLQLGTQYEIKVIAIDKDGKEKVSKIVNYTTSNKQYVYNYGKEYEEITGGWQKGISYSGGVGIKQSNYLFLNSPAEESIFTTYVFKTANKVDFSKFNTIHAKIKIENYYGAGGGLYNGVGTFQGQYSYYNGDKNIPNQPKGVVSTNEITQIGNCDITELSVELKKEETDEYIYAYTAAGGLGDRETMYVYQIWFE